MHNPLQQFLIKKLITIHVGGMDLSFTNSAAFMLLATLIILGFQYFSIRQDSAVPSRLQAVFELGYNFISRMLQENAGDDGRKFFPFIFSTFLFVLMGNVLGLLPYSFTYTSHIAVTFALAIVIFMTITITGLIRQGWKFFALFYPKNVPLAVAPLVIPVEIIAYLIRPLTLSIRLFANMMAGHIILKLFGGFTVAMGAFGLAPFACIIMLTGFEFIIAVLQAYVFTVLTCIYLNDALHVH